MGEFDKSFGQIIIVGNGFDLDQNNPTGYSDFIESSFFKDLLFHNHLAKRLQEKRTLRNWIDIENELKKYSLDESVTNRYKFKENFIQLKKALTEYLSSLDYSDINTQAQSYKILEEGGFNDLLIIDFNYTETVEIILHKLGRNKFQISNKIIKIHGSIKSNDIVLGVEDTDEMNGDHIFIKKACHKAYNGVNLVEYFRRADSISFFGHSFGETDVSFFNDFFDEITNNFHQKMKEKKNLNLYYFDEEGYDSQMRRIEIMTNTNLSKLKQNCDFKVFCTVRP